MAARTASAAYPAVAATEPAIAATNIASRW
jgi:hypothetical protein